MDLSIIIVNYDTNQLVIDCIRSIYEETKKSTFEIIIVDNHSQKEDPRAILDVFPEVKLVITNKNSGFGYANNLGITDARGVYILLLNSDTLVLDGALDKCIEFMNTSFAEENNIGLIGCRLLNGDKSYQHSVFMKASIVDLVVNSNPVLFKLFGKKSQFSEVAGSKFVAGVSGAFMLFRANVLKKIKPFDPDIFMYSEETDLCRNRVSKVCNIYYWDGAEIIHYGGGSSSNTKWQDIQAVVSFALITYKNNVWKFFIFIGSCILNYFTYLLLFPVYFFKKDRTPQRKLTQYWGLFRNVRKIVGYKRKWGSNKKPLKVNP